jgi:hypothetical protein
MPVTEVKLYDHRVNEESVLKMIKKLKLTDALAESSGAACRRSIGVSRGKRAA